jgi:dolichol-phosphate mannosyltransferase
MRSQEKIALVIPTVREAESLGVLLEEVRALFRNLDVPYEILVVDDDSRDGTEELVSAIAAQDARVRLLVRRGECGLAGAILHGWQHTDASLLGVMDADMQHPPLVLRDLLAAMHAGCDLALGSRYAGSARSQPWNPLRRFISAVSIWLALPLQRAGSRVRDPMSGYFIVRRRCVENILFRPTGFKLLLEILTRGRVHSVTEVPFTFGRRTAGRSKAGVAVAWQYVQLIARLYVMRLKGIRLPAGIPTD